MVHNERGPTQQSPNSNTQSPMAERVGKASEKEKGKEKSVVERMGTNLADIVRDIDTASKMAEDELDGRNAFLQIGQGLTSFGVGAGMEVATDALWANIWQGKSEFLDRFRIGGDVGDKLNKFALQDSKFDWKSRAAYFIKEGSQDIAIGGLYNMILGFRSQPLFVKAEAKHLLTSLSIDAGEAFLSPTLPNQVQREAVEGLQGALGGQIRTLEDKVEEYEGKRRWNNGQPLNDYTRRIAELQKEISEKQNEYGALPGIDKIEASIYEKIIRGGLGLSNPVSLLGIDMMKGGWKVLFRNIKEVRKVRKEKGIVGKKVEMEKKYEKKEWNNRDQGGRWQGNKDKVYYGKSNWKSADQKAQEEYELKAAS